MKQGPSLSPRGENQQDLTRRGPEHCFDDNVPNDNPVVSSVHLKKKKIRHEGPGPRAHVAYEKKKPSDIPPGLAY